MLALETSAFALTGVALLTAIFIAVRNWRRPPLPPSPQGLPLVGNILDLPSHGDPLPWVSHKRTYGPISSVTVLGQNVILLNDLQTSIELLDKRSSIYCGRPIFPFAGEMIGWDRQMIMAQYGEHFRIMRKLLKSYIGTPASIASFRPLQELETRFFLARVLDDPSNLISHIRLTAGAISLSISHGYSIETEKSDPLVNLVEVAAKDFYVATMPGAWLVDILPILRYVPKWVPGASFKRLGEVFRQHNMEQSDRPHKFVKKRMRMGTEVPSFTSNMLNNQPDAKTEHAIKFAATAIYGGGSDPAVAALSTWVLLMILHPEVQKRAREEIDHVVGTRRLPTLEDRPRLPYTEALLKEVLRWHTTGRICIPHRATQDDIYNGYLIPKNSIVLANMWNITRDPLLYSDPEEFHPPRFMNNEGKTPELDPNTYIFGFGRRACPGRDFANANMFIFIAMTLAVFEITKAKDENGVSIEPVCEFEGGTVSHPLPFKYDIKPRSEDAEMLIRSIHSEVTRRPSDGHDL